VTEKRPSWRLRKTLARKVECRPIEDEDMRFIWAAYKKGALATMGPDFADGQMDAVQFREKFENAVLENYHAGWTVFGETSRGMIPIGIAFGAWAPVGAYLIITGIAWFPWASKRNILEGTVAFFDALRNAKTPWVGYAKSNAKRLYEVCCMHSIMRRVGTSHIVFPGEPAAVFEGKV
jgi:hypothetical protein